MWAPHLSDSIKWPPFDFAAHGQILQAFSCRCRCNSRPFSMATDPRQLINKRTSSMAAIRHTRRLMIRNLASLNCTYLCKRLRESNQAQWGRPVRGATRRRHCSRLASPAGRAKWINFFPPDHRDYLFNCKSVLICPFWGVWAESEVDVVDDVPVLAIFTRLNLNSTHAVTTMPAGQPASLTSLKDIDTAPFC